MTRSKRAPLAVLLVEDNPDDALLVQEELREPDGAFDVHHAVALSEGVGQLSERIFDAVLLDLFLPDSDGTDSVQSLRSQFPDVPIVVLTGRDDEEFASNALHHGAQDYIVKGSSDAFSLGRSILYAVRRQHAHAQRKREQALEEQGRKLQSLAVLAGGIAHDFNNILMGILGNTASLKNTLADRPLELERVNEIENGAVRASDMTAQLLAYAGRGQTSRRHLDLNEMIEESERAVRPLLPGTIELSRRFSNPLPKIWGDATRLRQLVMNLLLNAADAMENEVGRLDIRTGTTEVSEADLRRCHHDPNVTPGTFVFLEVADDGCGMDPETEAHMFDPFFTTKGDGRGLGLASALGTVTSHGGALRVSSALAQGTSITVFLPAASENAPHHETLHEIAHGSPETVLVVEDESSVWQYVAAALESEGIRPLVATNGKRAIELFDEHDGEVDAVLLDWRLPDMRGNRVLAQLREKRPDVAVIVISGADDRGREARKTTSFLQKPFATGQLMDRLRSLLGSSDRRSL